MEDPLEEGMETNSSILAWRIPVDRGAWQATVHGVTKSQTQMSTHTHTNTKHVRVTKLTRDGLDVPLLRFVVVTFTIILYNYHSSHWSQGNSHLTS